MAHVHHHHGGDHDDPPLTTARAQRLLFAAVLTFALAAIVGLVLLWPDGNRPVLAEELGMGAELVDATVTHVEEVDCANTDGEMGRSEERRVGKEGVSSCSSRGSPKS